MKINSTIDNTLIDNNNNNNNMMDTPPIPIENLVIESKKDNSLPPPQ